MLLQVRFMWRQLVNRAIALQGCAVCGGGQSSNPKLECQAWLYVFMNPARGSEIKSGISLGLLARQHCLIGKL